MERDSWYHAFSEFFNARSAGLKNTLETSIGMDAEKAQVELKNMLDQFAQGNPQLEKAVDDLFKKYDSSKIENIIEKIEDYLPATATTLSPTLAPLLDKDRLETIADQLQDSEIFKSIMDTLIPPNDTKAAPGGRGGTVPKASSEPEKPIAPPKPTPLTPSEKLAKELVEQTPPDEWDDKIKDFAKDNPDFDMNILKSDVLKVAQEMKADTENTLKEIRDKALDVGEKEPRDLRTVQRETAEDHNLNDKDTNPLQRNMNKVAHDYIYGGYTTEPDKDRVPRSYGSESDVREGMNLAVNDLDRRLNQWSRNIENKLDKIDQDIKSPDVSARPAITTPEPEAIVDRGVNAAPSFS